jgi:DNA-directed RNA polymerase specialized sigma24 family protein
MAAAPAPAVTLSDEDLVLQAQHGDRVARGALFDRYASLVLGIGLRTLRDRGQAEDLVQEVS